MVKVILFSMFVAHVAFAGPLKLDCIPVGMESALEENGKAPMVLHLNVGTETVSKIDQDSVILSAEESGSTIGLEINFATHINEAGRGADVPSPVVTKDGKVTIGTDAGYAVMAKSDAKTASTSSVHAFQIEFFEGNTSMPFSCHVNE